MFKHVKNKICAFDLEWVPDIELARRMYGYKAEPDGYIEDDGYVLRRIYDRAGATEEDPRPFVKPILCRIVSIACVFRDFRIDSPKPLAIWSMANANEGLMISEFLSRIGKASPQLVGWNSSGADLPVLVQRAIANGVQASEFFKRPDKPWEGRDYFQGDDWHIDLMFMMSPYDRRTRPKLSEMAQACGFEGKPGMDGSDVCDMYFSGKLDEIRHYNEHDAVTTYRIWLRAAYCGGFMTEEQYETEQSLIEEEYAKRIAERQKVAGLFGVAIAE
jgi:3'-5' exonuclease